MPYAQNHFPFEKDVQFQEADFIAEGLDQTRGWFYTLLVIGTALFGKSPYKNVIVNGIVLAEDGEKMSKRKKNYPPVEKILDQFGADALRLYLINTPVVRAGDIKFTPKDIREVVRRYSMMFKNATKFYFEMIGLYIKNNPEKRRRQPHNLYQLKSLTTLKTEESKLTVMDQWILQCLDELIVSVHELMDNYTLNGIVEKFYKFIDQLSRWYMNLNKKRFKRCNSATPLDVLGNCLYYFCLISAPFAPFITEAVYQHFRTIGCPNSELESIHFHQIPQTVWSSKGELLELFEYVSDIVDASRVIRARRSIPSVKLPLQEITLVHESQETLKTIGMVEKYLKDELNIKTILYSTDVDRFVEYDVVLDIPKLKNRVQGKQIGMCIKYVNALSSEQKQIIGSTGVVPDNFPVQFEELKIIKHPMPYTNVVTTDRIVVEYDNEITDSLLEIYCANQFHRIYQKARKDAGLAQTDNVIFEYSCSLELNQLLNRHGVPQANKAVYIPQGIDENRLDKSCTLWCVTETLLHGDVTIVLKK